MICLYGNLKPEQERSTVPCRKELKGNFTKIVISLEILKIKKHIFEGIFTIVIKELIMQSQFWFKVVKKRGLNHIVIKKVMDFSYENDWQGFNEDEESLLVGILAQFVEGYKVSAKLNQVPFELHINADDSLLQTFVSVCS